MSSLDVWILPAGQARTALARLLNHRELQRDANGKPFVAGGPHFNLSHSGELALIAICPDAPVGVDLEAPRRLRNPDGLARRMCTPRELAHVQSGGDLLRLWVRKEAVAKAHGGGLTVALSGLDVLDPVVQADGHQWLVHDLPDPAPGYVAAVSWPAAPLVSQRS